MTDVNVNNPLEIQMLGMRALKDALGAAGMVRFIQQFDSGYGDYTKEKQENDDMSLDELDALLKDKKANIV